MKHLNVLHPVLHVQLTSSWDSGAPPAGVGPDCKSWAEADARRASSVCALSTLAWIALDRCW